MPSGIATGWHTFAFDEFKTAGYPSVPIVYPYNERSKEKLSVQETLKQRMNKMSLLRPYSKLLDLLGLDSLRPLPEIYLSQMDFPDREILSGSRVWINDRCMLDINARPTLGST